MVILFLLALVGFAYYQKSAVVVKDLTEQKTNESLHQSSHFVSSYIQKLEDTSSSLASSTDLRSYIKDPSSANGQTLKGLFETILKTNSDLVSATLITKTGQVISTDQDLTMQTSTNMMQEKWYQVAIAQKGTPVLSSAHQTAVKGKEKDWVISVTQEVVNQTGDNLGVLRLDIAYKTLSSYLDHLKLGKEGFAFIVNKNHEFVYHPKQTVYSSKADMDSMKPYIAVKKGYLEDKVYVSQVGIDKSNWTLIGVASLDELKMIRHNMFASFGLISLVAFFICIFGIGFAFRLWIKPLKDLQALMLAVGQGKRQMRAKEVGASEFVDLAKQFNHMLDEIDNLLLAVQEKEQKSRQYELQALSSQINPHFLYNTLDTIVWMAEFNDSRKVVELTQSLASYFRLALNNGNEEISLKSELEHVRQYLFIQKQRYGDKLNYEIEELPTYDQYKLPKLVLQPIVENAIYHGIKEIDKAGYIRISVTEEGDHLVISIYDNGQGINISKAQQKAKPLKQGGVGLANVDQRLKLQFGKSYHMAIKSQDYQYTEIQLYFPKKLD